MGNQYLAYFSLLLFINNLFTVEALPQNSVETETEDYSQCGKTSLKTTRMVNPSENVLSASDWPWMAAVFQEEDDKPPHWICDGILISNQWLITYEYCVTRKGVTAKTLKVRLGSLNLKNSVDDGAITVDVESLALYSEFSKEKLNYTYIALVRLAQKVKFTESIVPICILNEDEYKNDTFYHNKTPFFVGSTSAESNDDDPSETRLKYTQTEIVDNNECSKLVNRTLPWPIDNRVLCVMNKKYYTCHGETGGALIQPLNYRSYLAGIALANVQCDSKKPPAIFARIAFFADFIKKTIEL